MNRERAKELLPIIEAFANGEDLEFRLIGKTGWMMFPKNEELTITFPCDDYEYRIKPRVREFTLERTDSLPYGQMIAYPLGDKSCYEHVEGSIKVREVLE